MSPHRLFLAGLLIASVSHSAGMAAAPETTFASVVKDHYSTWTQGLADGKLTPARVDTLINSGRVKGDEAAALAAIHLHFRGHAAANPLAESALIDPQHALDADERRDLNTKPVNFERVFTQFRRHLNSVPRDLFDTNAPRRVGISQGRLGDCFVVAAVGTIAAEHSGKLKAMFIEEENGSCIVKFPGRKPVRVPKLTDAQIALGSTSGGQGLWLNVMEEAVALETRSKGGSTVVIDGISSGGNTARTIELLTGHPAKTIHLQPADAKERAAVEAEARKVLLAVHEHKILACASTPTKGELPPGIPTWHAFGVLDFDPVTERVTLWNPWGNKFEPKGGSSGLKTGYSTHAGEFTVPLKEFVKIYTSLTSQTTAPLAKK